MFAERTLDFCSYRVTLLCTRGGYVATTELEHSDRRLFQKCERGVPGKKCNSSTSEVMERKKDMDDHQSFRRFEFLRRSNAFHAKTFFFLFSRFQLSENQKSQSKIICSCPKKKIHTPELRKLCSSKGEKKQDVKV
jgi:hypothetical protein